jgi:hypothetical protein
MNLTELTENAEKTPGNIFAKNLRNLCDLCGLCEIDILMVL